MTSVGQKVPENAVEIAEQFLEDMKNVGEFANLANLDETPCYFDIPWSSTFDKKEVRTIKVKTTGVERLRLKKTENGLTPFDFLHYWYLKIWWKLLQVNISREWQSLAQKRVRVKCFMKKEIYVERIWKRRPSGFFNTGKSILLMDSAKSHAILVIRWAGIYRCKQQYKGYP